MQTNRIDDAVTENKYWEKCASHLHSLFPDKIRTGIVKTCVFVFLWIVVLCTSVASEVKL